MWQELIGLAMILFVFWLLAPKTNRKFKSKGEELTIESFEDMLGYEVKINYRPNFLKNPETGKNLELDGFDPKTKIAVEYNGIQHYKYPNIYHKSKEDFEKQQYRDNLKKELCRKHNVTLLVIPYTVDSNSMNNFERKYKIKNYMKSLVKV